MPLTDEQRALLQLLLEGGQDYDDIGGLLGISAPEVRARARAALQEMGGADPDSTVALTDYLLGQADPIGRADAVRGIQNDQATNELAGRLVAQLRLLAPGAPVPEVPAARGGGRGGPAPSAAPPPTPGPEPAPPIDAAGPSPVKQPLPARIAAALGRLGANRRAAFGLGAAAVLVVAVVVAVTVSSGDGEASPEEAGTEGPEGLTVVALSPLRPGSAATGQAVFGTFGEQPALRVNAAGLESTAENQNYIVWLFNSPRIAFPLARDQVGENGNLRGDVPIPQALVPLLPQFGCVDVSIATNRETQRALRQSLQGQSLPSHAGRSVLRGQIPAEGETAPSGGDSDCTAAAAAAAAEAGELGEIEPGGAQGQNGVPGQNGAGGLNGAEGLDGAGPAP